MKIFLLTALLTLSLSVTGQGFSTADFKKLDLSKGIRSDGVGYREGLVTFYPADTLHSIWVEYKVPKPTTRSYSFAFLEGQVIIPSPIYVVGWDTRNDKWAILEVLDPKYFGPISTDIFIIPDYINSIRVGLQILPKSNPMSYSGDYNFFLLLDFFVNG